MRGFPIVAMHRVTDEVWRLQTKRDKHRVLRSMYAIVSFLRSGRLFHGIDYASNCHAEPTKYSTGINGSIESAHEVSSWFGTHYTRISEGV